MTGDKDFKNSFHFKHNKCTNGDCSQRGEKRGLTDRILEIWRAKDEANKVVLVYLDRGTVSKNSAQSLEPNLNELRLGVAYSIDDV